MKITASAGALARALAFVGRAAARSGATQPVLTSALFEADKDAGVLKIGTTDTGLTARLSSAAPIIEEGGKAALPCRMLTDIVRALAAEANVRLETSDTEAALVTADGKNRYALRLGVAGDFPELAQFPDEGAFTLHAATLSDAISRVAPAASADTSRPVLTGVLFDFSADGATLVATDSFSMTLYKDKLEGAPEKGRAIIPARALKEVLRLCRMGPEQVEVAMTKSHAMFRVGGLASGIMLAIRLIEGTFPDHTKLMPSEQQDGKPAFAREYAAESGALIEALSRVSLFASSSTSTTPVPITLSFSDNPEQGSLDGSASLSISAVSQEVGSGAESIPVEPVEAGGQDAPGEANGGAADSMRIAFNPDFLLRAVKTCRGASAGAEDEAGEDGPEKVLFSLNASLKPAVIRPRGDSRLLTLIMPMRDTEAEEARKTRATPAEDKTGVAADAEEKDDTNDGAEPEPNSGDLEPSAQAQPAGAATEA